MSYSSAVLADSPVLYLRLEETGGASANDETANNNDGTFVNSPTLGVTGATPSDSGKGTLFASASSQHITVVSAASLDVGDSFTFECWVKRTSAAADHMLFWRSGLDKPEIRLNSSNAIDFRATGAGAIVASTSTVTADSTWHHVVVTKNGATSVIYLDTVDVTGVATNRTLNDTSPGTLFLAAEPGPANPLNGALDEIALYDTALSSARVTAHFNAAPAVAPTLAVLRSSIRLA